MRGSYHGKVGAFPCEFVDVVEDLPGPRKYEGWPKEWVGEAQDTAAPANDSAPMTTAPIASAAEQPKPILAAATTAAPVPAVKPLPKPRGAGDSAESKPLPVPKQRGGSINGAPAPAPKPAAKPAAARDDALPTARVIRNFSATNDDEMSLVLGQEVSSGTCDVG